VALMRRGLLLLLVVLWLPLLAQAQCPGLSAVLEPLDEEILPVDGSILALTTGVYQQESGTAVFALVQVRTAAIVYRHVGTPAPDTGVIVGRDGVLAICGLPSIRTIRLTRQTATTAMIHVIYYRAK
jgi:hypothetical protein